MTTTHGVPMPFSPYIVSKWTGPEMIDRKTWTAYTADQVRDTAIKYADARCAHFEAAMRQILEERGSRSDGDADVLVQRIRDMSIEDRDVIACAQGNFTEMKQRRDALAEKVKAMEDSARRALRCLREEVRPLDPHSVGVINSTIIDLQSVLYATPVDAAIDAAGGDQC